MKSRFVAVAVVLAVLGSLLALVACGPPPFEEGEVPGSSGGEEQPAGGGGEERATAAPSPTPVTGAGKTRLVSPYITEEHAGLVEQWVDDFTKKNPDIELTAEVLTDDQLADFLASAEQLSDVLIVPAGFLHDLHARGLLNTEVAGTIYGEFTENWFYPIPDQDTALADGTRLAVPYYAAVQGIWYRKDLFEKAGLEPPNTPENILAAAEALHDGSSMYGIAMPTATGDSVAIHHWLENLARASGVTAIGADGTADFGGDGFTAILQLYADLVQLGPPVGTTIAEARALFLDGQLAMIVDSTSLPQELKNRSTDVVRDEMAQNMGFIAAINDTAGDSSTTYGYSMGIAIGKDANESAAHALIAYLVDIDAAYHTYWIPQGWGPAMRGAAMQWRALKGHDWFGYYESGMPEDLLYGFRKSVRWRHAGDAAALATSRVYSAGLFPSAIESLLGGTVDAAGAAQALQEGAAALE